MSDIAAQFRAEWEDRIRNASSGEVLATANRIRAGGATGESIAREAIIAALFVDGWLWELVGITKEEVKLLSMMGGTPPNPADELFMEGEDWDKIATLAAKLARLVPPDEDDD